MSSRAAAPLVPITPEQLREARALLGWSRDRIGAHSGTSAHLLAIYELTGRVQRRFDARVSEVEPLTAIRAALEAAGVIFTNGAEPGVKLRRANT